MKNKKIFYSIIICIILICGLLLFNNHLNSTIYNPGINDDLSSLTVEEGGKYTILYDTQAHEFYLTQVHNEKLSDELFLLGDKPYNFVHEKNQTLKLVSQDQTITFHNQKYTKQKTVNNHIETLGLVEISFEVNDVVQITNNQYPVGCKIPLEQYNHFIAIDITQTE